MQGRPQNMVCVGIGQCGVQALNRVWYTLMKEHDLNFIGEMMQPAHQENTSILMHFQEHTTGKYTPRTLFIDSDDVPIEVLRTGKMKNFYGMHAFCSGGSSCANNYARGRYSAGRNILDDACDKYRTLLEDCDRVNSVLKINSFQGGTGTGLSNTLFEQAPIPKGVNSVSCDVVPSPFFSTATTNYYNVLFGLTESYIQFGTHFIFDNLSLYKKCILEDIEDINLTHINDILATCISGISCPMRFCGLNDGSNNLKKILTNLVPFPNLRMILSSATRFGSINYPVDYAIKSVELTCQVFKNHHRLCTPKLQDGTYLACNLQFRGQNEKSVLIKSIQRMYDLYEPKFTSWIPTPFRISTSWKPIVFSNDSVFKGTMNSCIMMSNNTIVSEILEIYGRNFEMLLEKRAFVHWYISQGMEEGEFAQCKESYDIISKSYHDVITGTGEFAINE